MITLGNILAGIGLTLFLKLMCMAHSRYGGYRRLDTEEYLSKMARIKHCSVYDLFLLAAREWRIDRSHVEADFTKYLFEDHIPYYVVDLVRRNRTELDNSPDLPLLMGRMF